MNNKIKEFDAGDIVLIHYYGGCYTTYQAMANRLGLKNYEDGHDNLHEFLNKTGVVLGGQYDEQSASYIYGIHLETGQDILMTNSKNIFADEGDCLSFVRKNVIITFDDDDLFKL